MPVISGSIPNLINGVSQQPFALRLASQAEEQINGFSSIVEGLTKRPPTRHVAKLINSLPENAHVHIINRDAAERYVVVAFNGDLRVYGFDGVERTVNFPHGKGYLANTSASFGAVTVADYTFFLNKDVTVAMSPETKAGRPPEGIVFVRQGNYACKYRIIVDGQAVAEKITSQTDPNDIQSSKIAQDLAAIINSWGSMVASVIGSTIHIRRADSLGFSLTTEDSLGDTGLVCMTKQTQTFANLPARAVQGYQVEISGTPGNPYDNFWVEYDQAGSGGNNGVWREIAAPGRQIAFDPATMPHVLVREANGSFTFKQADWEKCAAGSDETTPRPSFVGQRISDIFFYRNRLGFISDESVIFSRSAKFFNFWRETATDLLDTDPIDITTSHVKVSILRHAIPFNESLLLFSDQTQFMLGAGEVLTPSGVSLDQVTEFETSSRAKPVGAGQFVYFCTSRGEFTGVREYYIDGSTKTNNANDVTNHVPRYIRGKVFKLCASTNEDMLVALSDTDRDTLYVYKYYNSGQEKVQSSWSRWKLQPGDVILNAEFIESTLWLIVRRADGVYLDRLNIEPGVTDPGMAFVVHLDRRITEAQAEARFYYPQPNVTHIVLPYVPPDPKAVVIVARPGGSVPAGKVMPYKLIWNGAVWVYEVAGNLTHFYAGITYELRYTFSPFLIREDAPGGGRVANTEGRIQVRRCLLNYAETGYFRVEVTPYRRETQVYPFTGRIVGSGMNRLGQVNVETGSFRFSVMASNMNVKIELVNDTHLPSRHLNLDWEALYTVRTKRMQ
ncbi:tail tubular protein B [Azorhizobium caulinodans ORS 571]|uniref:Tail tubular protein B n=1 Tax=Azorhizobium caulinodans (strain ATCC 43989 / DSM 5975 / JCM 20966 / LMG 6465 / NBRC 14845 / NCIMB 13405 / ORS 571) TaxID=438753 RepID=A8IF68_AZOC5|nr:hypothetical protein [Azorhizobium caulinodans]BAF89581.1 tail tubular protein B [Azorhizobium caulinodans ORS 571]